MKGQISHRPFRVFSMVILLCLFLVGGIAPPTVSLAQPACGETLPPGFLFAGVIPSAGVACPFTFYGAAEDFVTITMRVRNGSALDPWLDLYDPYGNLLTSDDDSGGGRDSQISMVLPYSGLYRVVARDYGTGAGPFTLALQQTIQSDQQYFGNISSVGLQYRYLFNGTVGQRVSIAMIREVNSLDPWLDLLDPTGARVAYDNDSCGNKNSCINDYGLKRDGAYTIVARANNGRSIGQFRLSLAIH